MPTDLLPNERVELTEDRVPAEGIEDNIAELVELYGGKLTGWGTSERTFELPFRRGVAAGGGVECQLSWVAEGRKRGGASLSFRMFMTCAKVA